MSRMNLLVGLAGACLGLAGVAQAQSTDQSQSFRAELLGDASSRTSAQGGGTGPTLGGYTNFRYVVNVRGEAPPASEDLTTGFQTRYTKLNVRGNLINDRWGYFVQGQFNRNGGAFRLDDAYGTYKFENAWTAKWGQFKLPVIREESIKDTNQLAGDRSVFNSVFSQGRSQGIGFGYQEDGNNVRFMGAFSDGARSQDTDIEDASEADYAFTGRLDYKWAGDWSAFDQMTSWQGSGGAGMVGGAVHWQSGGDTAAGAGGNTRDVDILLATIDAMIKGDGWNVFGAFAYRTIDPAAGSSVDDFGFLVQGGIFVDRQWELFGRYDIVLPDDSRPRGPGDPVLGDSFNTITVGVNHYFVENSNAAKLTIEALYFMNSGDFFGSGAGGVEPGISADTGVGFLGGDRDDGQFTIRGNLQLVF